MSGDGISAYGAATFTSMTGISNFGEFTTTPV